MCTVETDPAPTFELVVTPQHELRLPNVSANALNLSNTELKRLRKMASAGTADVLLHLATELLDSDLPLALSWCREFSRHCLTTMCRHAVQADSASRTALAVPTVEELAARIETAPPMKGSEYLTPEALSRWWQRLHDRVNVLAGKQAVPLYLESRNPAWQAVGRVTFHLAENKQSEELPFAFIATYVVGLSSQGATQYQPLTQAIKTSASSGQRQHLLALLTPIQRAAQQLDWLQELVDSGGIYKPLAWSPTQAHAFLQSVDTLNRCGLTVRTPDWWHASRPSRPTVTVSVGAKQQNTLGIDALLDFSVSVTVDGQTLKSNELTALLDSQESSDSHLVRLRGRWVELDREKLKDVLTHWRQAARQHKQGVSFAEAMRWLAGAEHLGGIDSADARAAAHWVGVEPGRWLATALAQLRDPSSLSAKRVRGLKASLRPYQHNGVNWLHTMSSLQLGACLADDMGLGKTIQILALLLLVKQQRQPAASQLRKSHEADPPPLTKASLLVVPASLMANWQSEIAKFTPSLRATTLHPAETDIDLKDDAEVETVINSADLVITTYAMLSRLSVVATRTWRLLVLDEAQAIKNPSTRQTKAVKQLHAGARIALTGTPIENSLGDLWSLFDFLNPGLLGNATEFKRFVKQLSTDQEPDFSSLRRLVGPYILRRLKTDKRVISDLPEKSEISAYCGLSKQQAKLYQASVRELSRQLSRVDGMKRRGLVLAYLMRFKQICNHPAQWMGAGEYATTDSGKFQRLERLCSELAERQEKVLVFSQFREISSPLSALLEGVYGRAGLVLHGGTAVKKRQTMVDQFQQDDGPPFFVLSLKAGGTGLNLTAASHVIHFDRWWNPAVENQATDRAFRIGQKRNVMVHKFVCRGTIEEKIDQMINEKVALADSVLDADGGKMLTEMADDELMQFVALDINKAGELWAD